MQCSRKCNKCSNEHCPMRMTGLEENINILTQHDIDTDIPFYTISIDIGTTTIAFELIGKGVSIKRADINRQRVFGADVISRIEKSSGLSGIQLTSIIRSQICANLADLCGQIDISMLKNIVICGNTAMIHFLMGWDASNLGMYPFSAYSLESVQTNCRSLLNMNLDKPIFIFPGISGFVGGDIVADILYLDFDKRTDSCFLIDLGTNGELALRHGKNIFTASTAAGPAFEGGGISCGCPSVPGAISGYDFASGTFTTIDNAPPKGICGSGIIEIAAELTSHRIIDQTGLFKEEHFKTGFQIYENIRFTQEDVRQFQLAKAAVRSGMEILLKKARLKWSDISNIYLAGGLGHHLSKAQATGLLPGKVPVSAIGNGALGGALKFSCINDGEKRISKLVSSVKSVELALEPEFDSEYINAISFPSF